MTHLYYFTLLGSTSIKAVRRMLMKLTPGLSFTNIFTYSFYAHSSPNHKNSVKQSVSFYAFGTYERKSCTQNVDEIDTWSSLHPFCKVGFCCRRSSRSPISCNRIFIRRVIPLFWAAETASSPILQWYVFGAT